MSLLETFYILFESDSANVSKGAADAKKNVDDLNKSLSASDKISNKVGASFQNFIRNAGGALIAAFSVGAITSGIVAAAQFSVRLNELSKALGVDVEALSAWGDAVKKYGGSVEGFQETVKSMTASLADFATKGTSRAAPFFKELGIHMTDGRGKARDFLEVLPEIASAFEKIGKQQSFGIGQKMGLDQGTIMLLQQGRRAVEDVIARQKELGVITQQDAEIAAKYNDQLDDTQHAFRSLFVTIGSTVLPGMADVLKTFERVAIFFRKHSDLIIGSLVGIGAAITYYVAPAIASLVVTMAPFLGIGAVIGAVAGAFALLYEDFKVFDQGGESLIGDIIEKWPIVGDILKNLTKLAGLFFDLLLGAGKLAIDIFTRPLEAWTLYTEAVGRGIEKLLTTFPQIGEVLTGVWDRIKNVTQMMIDYYVGKINFVINLFEKVKSVLGLSGDTNKLVIEAQKTLTTVNQSPLNVQPSANVLSRANTRNTNVQIGEVTVNTQATDADGIASSISGSLDTQIAQTINDFDDGILA